MQPKLSEREKILADEVAKDIFTKRLYNIRDMSGPELTKIGIECYKKALYFIAARREILEML